MFRYGPPAPAGLENFAFLGVIRVPRLPAVMIVVFGVALFPRLARTIFQPQKVSAECGQCGLKRHDPDAVHCMHRGALINIESDGEWG